MTVVLPNPTFRSSITKLPAHLRTPALNKLSANANAPGAGKKQRGRAQQAAARNLRNALGIYLIESNITGPLAASVGGATPATITVEGGTPATTDITAGELDPVTWLSPATVSMSVTIGTEVGGNAKVVVA